MKEINKNLLTLIIITVITTLTLYSLSLIPGFLRHVEADDIVGFQPAFILIFLIFDAISIGIPAWIHRAYVRDYSKISSVWFFALFGGIIGAILGEVLPTLNPANFVMIIPYTILMLVYAFLYKRFTWWKVASTAYLGGIIVENAINRSPIQLPTLIWISLFIYPYFFTKIWENRQEIRISSILKDLKWTILTSVILAVLAAYASKGGGPLPVLAVALPFLITALYRFFNKRECFEKRKKIKLSEIIKNLRWVLVVSAVLVALAVYVSRDNISPPLIIFGAVLPFLITALFRLFKKRAIT
jgi:4-hydroxybenzoate polyprenyltransferase